MSKSLLELSDEMVELDDLLAQVEDPEAPEVQEAIARLLDLTSEREHKVNNYCGLIRELELRAQARNEEAKRLAARAKVSSNLADSLIKRLQMAMETMGIKKVETDHFTVTRAKNGGKVPMTVNEDDAPDEYWELVETAKLNKQRIREELEAGKDLPFAKLEERGESLRIK